MERRRGKLSVELGFSFHALHGKGNANTPVCITEDGLLLLRDASIRLEAGKMNNFLKILGAVVLLVAIALMGVATYKVWTAEVPSIGEKTPTAVKSAAEPSGAGQLTKAECLQLGPAASDYARCRELLGYNPLSPVQLQPTAAPTAPTTTTATSNSTSNATLLSVASPVLTTTKGRWSIKYYDGATADMKKWVVSDLDPRKCNVFPNVNGPCVEAKDGVYYGQDKDIYAQNQQTADFPVAARHVRLYSGTWAVDRMGSCTGSVAGTGCLLVVTNVGDVTAIWRAQRFDTGFTVSGQYFNGDKLPQAMWALMSFGARNMLNIGNSGTNMGANCSVPGGCTKVDTTFVVTSGNEILMIWNTVVDR